MSKLLNIVITFVSEFFYSVGCSIDAFVYGLTHKSTATPPVKMSMKSNMKHQEMRTSINDFMLDYQNPNISGYQPTLEDARRIAAQKTLNSFVKHHSL
jgi:hypothetical protein